MRAEVLSLGDARSYHLTTAQNQLGVVYARSAAGECPLPAWWRLATDCGDCCMQLRHAEVPCSRLPCP